MSDNLGPRDPRHVALDVAKVIGEAVARLARLDESVELLGDPGRIDHAHRIEHVRRTLREVRDMLRPIDVALWRAARSSMADEEREDAERTEAAKRIGGGT